MQGEQPQAGMHAVVLASTCLVIMYIIMTILADQDKPFNWFSANIIFGVFGMMDLGSASATINTAPVIPPEHYITLPLPFIGLKIVPVIIATTFTSYLKYPLFKGKQG
jgi:hypothetical protein